MTPLMRRGSTDANTDMNQASELPDEERTAVVIKMLQQAITNSLETNESNRMTKKPGRTVEGEGPRQLHEGNVVTQPLRLVLAVVDDFFHQVGGGWAVQQGDQAHLDCPRLGEVQAAMRRPRGKAGKCHLH